MAAATYHIFGSKENTAITFFIFCATLLSYNLQRILNRTGKSNHSIRLQWINVHRKQLWLISGMATIFLLMNISMLSHRQLILCILLFVLTTLYYLPGIAFRKYGILKPMLVALVWTNVTVVLPLMDQADTTFLLLLSIHRFLFICLLAIIFDARDVEPDSQDKIITLPVQLGLKKTKKLLYLLCMILIAYTQCLLLYDILMFHHYIVMQVSAIAAIAIVYKLSEKNSEFYYLFLVDGLILFQALALIISTT